MLEVFNNRYDIRYLEKLLSLLAPDHLIKTAMPWDREENHRDYYPEGSSTPEKLTRVVKIDFCGFSSTTLLGITSKNLEAEILAVNSREFDKIIQLRAKIHQRFTFLLSKEGLKQLNDAGVCLRIRFCFSYLNADFSISLMRGEDSNIWDARMDHEVSFSRNAPMTVDEWEASFIYNSQIASLKEIGRLCTENPELARIEDYNKAVNTFETRFAVVPTPQCLLIINNIAITDAYVYAKVIHPDAITGEATRTRPLSVSCPINVVEKSKGHNAFDLWRQHFLYTWRHDLTMYADMCTRFEADNPAGLAELLPPIIAGSKKKMPHIDWQKKVNRIIQRRIELDKNKTYDPKAPDEVERIKIWLSNVEEKMRLSTRKMPEMPTKIDPSKLSIEIGWKDGEYYVKMAYRVDPLFYMTKKKHSIAFCAIAHFAFAQKHGFTPIMHKTVHITKEEFKRNITNWLGIKPRIKNKKFTKHTLFKEIIDTGQGNRWSCCIPADNITFTNTEEVSKATYKNKEGDFVSCLQY